MLILVPMPIFNSLLEIVELIPRLIIETRACPHRDRCGGGFSFSADQMRQKVVWRGRTLSASGVAGENVTKVVAWSE